MTVLNTDYWISTTFLNQNLRENGFASTTLIMKNKHNLSKSFKLTKSKKIELISFSKNILPELFFNKRTFLIEQFNITSLRRQMLKKYNEMTSKELEKISQQFYSIHFVQTGGIVQSKGKLRLLDDGSVYGKKQSLFIKENKLFELTKNDLNNFEDLNIIGEQIES